MHTPEVITLLNRLLSDEDRDVFVRSDDAARRALAEAALRSYFRAITTEIRDSRVWEAACQDIVRQFLTARRPAS